MRANTRGAELLKDRRSLSGVHLLARHIPIRTHKVFYCSSLWLSRNDYYVPPACDSILHVLELALPARHVPWVRTPGLMVVVNHSPSTQGKVQIQWLGRCQDWHYLLVVPYLTLPAVVGTCHPLSLFCRKHSGTSKGVHSWMFRFQACPFTSV